MIASGSRPNRFGGDNESVLRLQSEERGYRPESNRTKLRPMARSTDNSMEGLRATDSSPSVLPGAPEDEDDSGVYCVPYADSDWIYIDDHEEFIAWTKQESVGGELFLTYLQFCTCY